MTAETISFPLDPGAAALLTRLHATGHAAYAVGGCVRDSLLGQTPHDWDLCTSATPEQVLELFGKAHCIPTGLQHGTVTVKHGGELYEITTFRTEGAYSDGRHPDHVAFVPDVKEDLARRDFTINAMAYNAEEGLIDPFGGQNDLAAGIVRAVGEPQRRFEEDALRILRLYRFAARFGFAIDPDTGQAARALCRHLDCVSEERIAEELSRLLAAPAPGAYLEAEVLAVIFPELDAAELPESRRVLDALEPGMEHVQVRLAALLCPLGEAGARAALRRLKCSNALTGTVATLVREAAAGMPGAALTLTARRFLSRYDLATITDLTALCSAQHPEQAEAFAALQQEAARLVETNACCRINQLAVNGRDLMDAGIRPGPGLRKVLDALLEQVLTGQLPNEKAALLAAAAQVAAS